MRTNTDETDEFTRKLIENQDYLFNLTARFNLDFETRQDLVSDITLKLLEKRDTFKAGTNFKAWITRITYNQFINEYRKNKKFGSISYDDEPAQIYSKASDETSDSNIIYTDCLKYLDKLSYIDKQLLLGRLQGYSYQQLADILELPEGTIKSKIYSAKKKLQKFIENETRNYC